MRWLQHSLFFYLGIFSVVLLTGCAGGAKAPASSVDHVQEIKDWVSSFSRTCLERNLTLSPFPQSNTYLPLRLRDNHSHRLAGYQGSGIPHSCAFWRTSGGKSLMWGYPGINADTSAGWNNEFFIYHHHRTLIDELKATFGVIYHESQNSVDMCSGGNHHIMLLRDGKTVIYLDFMYWRSGSPYCQNKNQYQAVMLRLAQPCPDGWGSNFICGPQRTERPELANSSGYSDTTFSNGYRASARWTNSSAIEDDVIIRSVDVLNLDRLTEDQQLEVAERWEQETDQQAYYLNVAKVIDMIQENNAGIRAANQEVRGIISTQNENERRRSDNLANMFAQSMTQSFGNLQQSAVEINQRQTQMADMTRQTLSHHQQIQALTELEKQRFFDVRQLPAANPMTQPVRSETGNTAMSERLLTARAARCRAQPNHRWDAVKAICIASAPQTARIPVVAGAVVPGASTGTSLTDKSNQCWFLPEPPHTSCVDTQVEWREGALYLRNRNQCSRRIYVEACGQRGNSENFCAVSGISPGNRWSHWVYADWQPTGVYQVKWVGSERGSEDWTCASEAGWHR